jgi:hypothetical protein
MDDRLGRILAVWVAAAQQHARAVLIATFFLTVAALTYAGFALGVNMHHTAILDDDLPFWKQYNEFAEVFPILDEALLVVIDADTATEARDAALTLANSLKQRPEAYKDVYVPGGDEFFERNALLYLTVDEIEELSDQLASVQPLLASVAQDNSLANMASLLQEGIEQAREHPETPVDLTLMFDSLSNAVKAVLEGSTTPISWTELILRKKMPGDSARRVVVLEPVFDYDHVLPGYRAMADVRQSAIDLGLTPENRVRVRVTGNVALNTEEMMGVVYGAALAVGSSLLLVAVILGVALRSWHLVVAVLITLLVSLFWTTGFATAAVGHINLLSVCFAILVIGLGVDFGIHLQRGWLLGAVRGDHRDEFLRLHSHRLQGCR